MLISGLRRFVKCFPKHFHGLDCDRVDLSPLAWSCLSQSAMYSVIRAGSWWHQGGAACGAGCCGAAAASVRQKTSAWSETRHPHVPSRRGERHCTTIKGETQVRISQVSTNYRTQQSCSAHKHPCTSRTQEKLIQADFDLVQVQL